MYNESEIAVPPNAWERHPFDNGELSVRDELLAPIPRTPEAIRLHRREYFAILSHADAQIGRVLDTLERQGILDETLVVFSSDHGLALGEHGLMGKQNSYDHSIRVPLVFAGPHVPRGEVRDALVYSGSILATICELTDVAVPSLVEFKSLAGVLRRDDQGEPAVYGAYRHLQRLIRTQQFKLIVYPEHDRSQLFDIASDPWEVDDLADCEAFKAVREQLGVELQRMQRNLDDPLIA